MRHKPTLADLGLDGPAPPATKKTIQEITDEVDRNDFTNVIRCRNCSQLIHKDSAACAYCKKAVINPLASENKPANPLPATQTCRYCRSVISSAATKCPKCQEWLIQKNEWNGVAAILSFFLPGLGQLYKGDVFGGIIGFVVTAIGYVFIFPGLLFHLIMVVDAGYRQTPLR